MKQLRCPSCNSLKIIKKGKQKRNIGFIQRYQCKKCKKLFIDKQIKHISYPANVIFQALNNYNLGNSLDATTKMVNKKFNIKTNRSTVFTWINKLNEP